MDRSHLIDLLASKSQFVGYFPDKLRENKLVPTELASRSDLDGIEKKDIPYHEIRVPFCGTVDSDLSDALNSYVDYYINDNDPDNTPLQYLREDLKKLAINRYVALLTDRDVALLTSRLEAGEDLECAGELFVDMDELCHNYVAMIENILMDAAKVKFDHPVSFSEYYDGVDFMKYNSFITCWIHEDDFNKLLKDGIFEDEYYIKYAEEWSTPSAGYIPSYEYDDYFDTSCYICQYAVIRYWITRYFYESTFKATREIDERDMYTALYCMYMEDHGITLMQNKMYFSCKYEPVGALYLITTDELVEDAYGVPKPPIVGIVPFRDKSYYINLYLDKKAPRWRNIVRYEYSHKHPASYCRRPLDEFNKFMATYPSFRVYKVGNAYDEEEKKIGYSMLEKYIDMVVESGYKNCPIEVDETI